MSTPVHPQPAHPQPGPPGRGWRYSRSRRWNWVLSSSISLAELPICWPLTDAGQHPAHGLGAIGRDACGDQRVQGSRSTGPSRAITGWPASVLADLHHEHGLASWVSSLATSSRLAWGSTCGRSRRNCLIAALWAFSNASKACLWLSGPSAGSMTGRIPTSRPDHWAVAVMQQRDPLDAPAGKRALTSEQLFSQSVQIRLPCLHQDNEQEDLLLPVLGI